jgi:hypothetical protein
MQYTFGCEENGDSDEHNERELEIKKLTSPET